MQMRKLHPEIGAEIIGVTMADVAANDDIYRAVRAAFEEYSVLLFRKQPISDETQVAYSSKFGPLETAKAASLGEGTPFSILTNIDPVTKALVPPGHKEDLRAKANQLWHTDSSFRALPALASVLSARTIPGEGGETEFVSQRASWNRLSPALKEKLSNCYAWHSYAHSRGKIDPTLASQRERDTLPPACWRMRWRNPVNGRDALYIASHTGAIEGIDQGEALKLIDELLAISTEPGHAYTHVWEPGDVLMWDNRASLHRGRPWPGNKPRYMIRTTISCTKDDGLAGVRPPQ
ncbi:MAG: TauD/TfdA family dioxygenase [Betaproteobacteria bacterium]|nr:TauD/TfdA family dioxygenase [Betaproteobacteria bacterium]